MWPSNYCGPSRYFETYVELFFGNRLIIISKLEEIIVKIERAQFINHE